MNRYLAIDIGGTFIKYALIDEYYQILKKWKKPTLLFNNKEELYDYFCADIPALQDIVSVGVSVPGILGKDGIMKSQAASTINSMYQTHVSQEISQRLHKSVYAINDARSAGLCELKLGNAQKTNSSAYFIIGTGVGGCFYNNESSIQGTDNIAGELSFLPFAIKNHQIVSLSHYASMSALIEMYNHSSSNSVQFGTEICQRYIQKEELAKKVIEEWCENIIFALNTLTICYNPEIICIGGGISEEDWFIEKIQTMYRHHLPQRVKHLITTRIERCLFCNDANLLGAVLWIHQNQSQ